MKARGQKQWIKTTMARTWDFCYDIAYHFRNDESVAGRRMFDRAKRTASDLESLGGSARVSNGLALAKDWKRGDL